MTAIRPRRSVLYMPGSNARAIEKARGLPCDAVILDLEDSVAPEVKTEARGQVCGAVKAGGFGPREVVIRVNAAGSEWHEADIRAAMEAGPDAILLPKVGTAEDVLSVRRMIGEGVALWAMIETPAAILNAESIADAGWLAAFVLGLNDLAKETGARFVPGRAPMAAWMSTALIAARSAGLAAIDGVYNALSDDEGFEAECTQARDFGFDGKTLIHPKQIAAANRIFAPSDDEVSKAREIVALFERPENRGKGAVALDGRMVERLHAEMAARTVALSEAITTRGTS